MKVAILVYSLSSGGAERSSAILSRMLAYLGYEVTLITWMDNFKYAYSGKLICVEREVPEANKPRLRYRRFLFENKHFKQNSYDYVIDSRSRYHYKKFFLRYVVIQRRLNMVYILHNSFLELYITNRIWLSRILYNLAFRFVGVSQNIVQNIQEKLGSHNVVCIYNAIDRKYLKEQSEHLIDIPEKRYILTYGRLSEKAKDYTFLMEAYADSELPILGIPLFVMGDGPDKDYLLERRASLGLENHIVFKPFTPNPFPYVKNALFTTLTSNYEGFPMVLVEAMALGTPVVAVDCVSGPSEIIRTGENGILVPFKDRQKFTEAMNRMVTDTDFYQQCKKGTVESVEPFTMEKVALEWKQLLERN